ncbi:TPA: YopX family protein [Streptococcus agalactiae]
MGVVEAIDYVDNKIYTFYRKVVRRYIPFEEAVLMQSTGLKDKNGIEVFDGDIVKCCRLFNDSLSEYVGQVKFVDFGWNIVDKADTHDPFYNYKDGCPYEIREIENIGNIHENPELLERLEG